MFGWIFVIVAIAVAAFFLARARTNASSKIKKPTKPKSAYAGLEFVPDKHCCDAATGTRGRRFLIAEAPKVPLARCSDPALCRCKYRNVEDRRAGDDRRDVVGVLSREMPIGDDRKNSRAGRERRKEDISFDYDK